MSTVSGDSSIIAHNLVKKYGSVTALDGLNLEVRTGSVLGLLGPNGAGKTTAVSILTTLVKPTSGSATVAGIDVLAHPHDVRKRIGLSGQYAAVDEHLTATENLEMIGRLYGMNRREAKTRAQELIERFRLSDAAHRPLKTFSGGMRRRIDLAGALIADPPVLFLDEPTTGLDVTVQAEIMQLLKQIRKDLNTSIILVSHDLPLINEVCDDIVIMHAGATVEKIPSAKIKATRHPYTEALYRSRIDLVEPRGKLVTIKGQPPTVGDWPVGCRFAGRCDYAQPECSTDVELPMISLGANQVTQCIRHAEIWGK